MPTSTTPDTHSDSDSATAASVPVVHAPAFSQTTHPSTTSHDPGQIGRAAISKNPEPTDGE